MQPAEFLTNFTEDLLSREDLEWMLSDAEVSGARHVLMAFTTDSNTIPRVNVVFSYMAGVGLIEWLRVEVLVSKDIEAASFFTKQYSDLIRGGGEVIVRGDGISVFYRVDARTEVRRLRDYVQAVAEVIGVSVGVLRYVGYTLIPDESL
ncbi:MAG: hypothetical protein QXS42_04450 [Zestosphaera sp.]